MTSYIGESRVFNLFYLANTHQDIMKNMKITVSSIKLVSKSFMPLTVLECVVSDVFKIIKNHFNFDMSQSLYNV